VFENKEAAPLVATAGRPNAVFHWPVAALLVVMVVVPGIALWRPLGPTPEVPSTHLRVAVLPFTQYAAGGADEMLAARITDGVTTELARLNVVGVVSRTTALQFSGTRKPMREIAELLNASEVIEGTVVSDGDIVRVRTRIVNGRTDLKAAVRDFEGGREQLDDLVRRIAEALSASFQARVMR
jgi:adenylate cyclase